jgi:hypothetical protein
MPLTASRGLSWFVRAVLARSFADVVRSLQSTPPLLCWPVDHSIFAADASFDVSGLIPADSSFYIQRRIAANSSLGVRFAVPMRSAETDFAASAPSRYHTLPPCRILRCSPDGLGCRWAPLAATATRNTSSRDISTRIRGARGSRRLRCAGRGQLAERVGRTGRNEREQGRRSGGCAMRPLSARNDDLGRNELP